jgi:hypothetical protein
MACYRSAARARVAGPGLSHLTHIAAGQGRWVVARAHGEGHMPIDYSGNADVLDAFEGALKELTVERTHPEALVVAERIITFAKAGVRDPARLRYLAVEAIRVERRQSIAHPWALGRC